MPGDKSISHRRALFSALTDRPVTIDNFGSGADCASSLDCLATMGKRVERNGNRVSISGRATRANVELDCGNSGTTARLLMGLLAGRTGEFRLHGDESLSRRPMRRVAEPLRQMGAAIELQDDHLPARIVGSSLTGVRYDSSVASAQVKSAMLLAGLHATGETCYREPSPSRDHTERLLGVQPDSAGWLTLNSALSVSAEQLSGAVPGDPSSAAFWVCAALMLRDSNLRLDDVLLNTGRIQFVNLLQAAGAQVEARSSGRGGGEAFGELACGHARLRPLRIDRKVAAQVIDEIPILSVLAGCVDGVSEFHEVGELRVKESDRLALIVENLRAMGAEVNDWSDGFAVRGPVAFRGATIRTAGDHRIAMAFAIAGLCATGETVIDDADCVAVSYPEFWDHLRALAPDSIVGHE